MKPYAILKLKDLKLVRFEIKDEWRSALAKFKSDGVNFVALKWEPALEEYVVQDLWK